jgi:GxxExxY protein
MTEKDILELCDKVREASFALDRFLRHGHLEKVYENGLANRLRKQNLKVQQQFPLEVRDEDGTVLGSFLADLFIEDCLVVELKACSALAPDHEGQLFGYLRASRIEHGMLINFGGPKLQVRKYILNNI